MSGFSFALESHPNSTLPTFVFLSLHLPHVRAALIIYSSTLQRALNNRELIYSQTKGSHTKKPIRKASEKN
jgi:hypothetical protein